MNKTDLGKLSKSTLIELAEMYSRNWQTLDALWFGNIEAECGLDTAIRIDIQNWRKQAVVEAKRIKKVLKIDNGGLSAVLTVLSMMSWQLTSPLFEIEYESPERIVFYYSQCAVQEGRMSKHKPGFPCKPMKLILLSSIAQVVEPEAKVKCLHAPPDVREAGFWCKWELSLVMHRDELNRQEQ
jgi:hypothetical protein